MSGNRLRKNKRLVAAVTLALVSSIGAPAWGEEPPVQPPGGEHYGYIGASNQKDLFLPASDWVDIKSVNKVETEKYTALKLIHTIAVNGNKNDIDDKSNSFVVYVDGLGGTKRPEYDSLRLLAMTTKGRNIFASEKSKEQGYNVVVVKIYNLEKQDYDTHLLHSSVKAFNGMQYFKDTEIASAVNDMLKNPEVVQELQEASAQSEAAYKKALGKYLPQVYLAKAEEGDLDALVAAAQNGQTINEYDLSASKFLPVSFRMDSIEISKPAAESGDKTHAYEIVAVEDGAAWRPEDRAVAETGGVSMPQGLNSGEINSSTDCYIMDENGNVMTSKDLDKDNPLYYMFKWDSNGSGIGSSNDQGQSEGWKDSYNNSYNGEIDIENVDGIIITPLNSVVTAITVEALTTGVGSVIDMSSLNTRVGADGSLPLVLQSKNGSSIGTGYYYTNGKGEQAEYSVYLNRNLLADTATLGQDSTLRLGVYGDTANQIMYNDAVYITTAQPAAGADGKSNINIQLGWVPGLGLLPCDEVLVSVTKDATGYEKPGDHILLGIYNGAENFKVTAQKSLADGIFSTYEITPVISRHDDYFKTEASKEKFDRDVNGNYYREDNHKAIVIMDPNNSDRPFRAVDPEHLTQAEWDYLQAQGAVIAGTYEYDNQQGTAWVLDSYTYEDTGEIAESGKSIAENGAVQRNFIKANNLSLFRRGGLLHSERLDKADAGGKGPGRDESGLQGEPRESLWADMWHGKFDAKAGYGRSASQSYNGFQLGYDKLLGKKFYNGKVYTGFYAGKLDGKSSTATGKGEQDAYSVGVYGSWVGDKGHFIDLGISAAKIKNDYYYTGNTGTGTIGKVQGENSTWAYGLGVQYGKRNELSSGWFWEPSASLFVGHVDDSSYGLSNGLKVHEQGYDTAISKLGFKTGKQLGTKGDIYAGLSWGHEFAGDQKLHQSYGSQSRLLENAGGHDSWWEWSAGGKVRISPNGTFNLDFIKTTGSSVGNDWSINGGLDFSWGGFGSGKGDKIRRPGLAADTDAQVVKGYAKAGAPTVVVGQAPQVGGVRVPQPAAIDNAVAGSPGAADYAAGEAAASVVYDNTVNVSGTVADGMGEFELGALTVEGKRPDWEKSLSPGQVSVIYPSQFEGEQKNLPELLDRVPGLFVQRLNGIGHYTVARVRGSTAAQVSVYVDGVQMNLTGDAAVNLSAIPADNIERIEVYRGYVPARFSGAPLGGVINIVTKHPNEGHGHITQGVRSYGGYTSTYEYSTPLGSGSLLATFGRDIWQGDFDFIYPNGKYLGLGADGNYKYADETHKRRSNQYQNNNALLKWQDEHWTVKGVWKKQSEGLARAITNRNDVNKFMDYGFYDGEQEIDYKEFLLGRRDTIGNLDIGWHIAYLDSKKTYQNTGGMQMIANTDKWGSIYPPEDGMKEYGITEKNFLPSELWGSYHSKKWNGNLNLAYKMGASHLLEFNADLTRETMHTNGNRWDMTQEEMDTQTGVNRVVRKMLSKYNNREYHFTLQDTITLNDDGDLKLTPVLRADKVEMEGLGPLGVADARWKYSGGVALQKQLNDHWSVKSTWGTYNRHPNFYEIFGDGGFIGQSGMHTLAEKYGFAERGTWETGSQFDFSLNWQGRLAKADTDTILTWFQRKAKNQLVLWTPMGGGGLSCYYPTGAVDVYGLELSHNMKWQRLNLALAATWQRSSAEPATKMPGSWFDFSQGSYVPEWVVSARLDYLFPGDKLNVFGEYHYSGEEILNGGSSNTADARVFRQSFSLFDMGVKYKFDKNWKLSAGVNDVFDKGREVYRYDGVLDNGIYHKPSYYPLAGRMYYTTLEYTF